MDFGRTFSQLSSEVTIFRWIFDILLYVGLQKILEKMTEEAAQKELHHKKKSIAPTLRGRSKQ